MFITRRLSKSLCLGTDWVETRGRWPITTKKEVGLTFGKPPTTSIMSLQRRGFTFNWLVRKSTQRWHGIPANV